VPLSPSEAEEIASQAFEESSRDRKRLDRIREYLDADQRLVWLPLGAPRELQALSQMAKVNVLPLVVSSSVQQLFVDGYATESEGNAQIVWGVWQRNRMDRRQLGVHRAAASYGVSYVTVMPGDNGVPVLRAVSPRKMTALYGDDPDWPRFALEQRDDGVWRLYDSTHTYDLRRGKRSVRSSGGGGRRAVTFEMIPGTEAPHEQDVTPVVRYVSDEDLDNAVHGDVEPLFPLQDTINLLSFHQLMGSHYTAHGRRVIISRMVGDIEKKLHKASPNSIMTINAAPEDVRIDEMSQADMSGFLDSRESALRILATLSQTPVSELTGVVANLAAEALVEARESSARKNKERRIVLGESHEQALGQAGTLLGVPLDPMARVRWQPAQDLRAIQMVDMLAVLADKLAIPAAALLDHLPFSGADIEEMRAVVSGGGEETEAAVESGPEGVGDEARQVPDVAVLAG
jgi:hypothetical protein